MTVLGQSRQMAEIEVTPPGKGRTRAIADGPVRVMIVDDSAVLSGFVSRWIDEDPDLEVVARHANGKQAIDDVARSRPDVIVLDVDMPVMGGLDALPLLTRACPKARVLMVSTLTRRNAEISLKALELGAVDYVAKPETSNKAGGLPEFRRELMSKLKGLAPCRSLRPRGTGDGVGAGRFVLRPFSVRPPSVIVIGSSTGGPEALSKLLVDIAPSLGRTPVLVAQHMPPIFTAALAERLAYVTGIAAAEARDRQTLTGGQIHVAPGGHHMTIEAGAPPRIAIRAGPAVNFYRPSVDLLFNSAADVFGSRALGIVLTGMGSDGTDGAVRIADAGGTVIAQDMRSSVIWGMPGSAAEAGACAAILPLGDIATVTSQLLAGRHPEVRP